MAVGAPPLLPELSNPRQQGGVSAAVKVAAQVAPRAARGGTWRPRLAGGGHAGRDDLPAPPSISAVACAWRGRRRWPPRRPRRLRPSTSGRGPRANAVRGFARNPPRHASGRPPLSGCRSGWVTKTRARGGGRVAELSAELPPPPPDAGTAVNEVSAGGRARLEWTHSAQPTVVVDGGTEGASRDGCNPR